MGIPIVYFRSSSFNCHRFCPQQYLVEYFLGWRGPSNKKADKGTIVHKVLEVAALAKKAAQDGKKTFVDDVVGETKTADYREAYLEELVEKVYNYYTKAFNHHEWTNKDLKDCKNWTWKALKINGGMFDPRHMNVVAAEPHFDFEIKEDWAKYQHELPDGTKLDGYLSMKGTVDLVTALGDGVYEIIDWKTGKRLDWATGETKDQKKLWRDAQLRMYHLAMAHRFPEARTFLITIYFINDGGPFTVHFQDKDLPKTKEMIQKKFEFIKSTQQPTLIKETDPSQSWKCRKLCHAGMTSFEGTHIEPIKNVRYNRDMTKCEQIKNMIKKKGVEWGVQNYNAPEFNFASYKAPGSVE